MPGMCTQVPEESEGGWREKTHKKTEHPLRLDTLT